MKFFLNQNKSVKYLFFILFSQSFPTEINDKQIESNIRSIQLNKIWVAIKYK